MTRPPFLTGDSARDQRNVDLLLDAVEELYGTADLDSIVRRAVDRAILVTGAERGILLLADDRGDLRVRVARDRSGADVPGTVAYSATVVREVRATRSPRLLTGTEGGQPVDFSRSAHALRLRSILAVPLLVGDRAMGVLYVDSKFVTKEFTDGDRSLFEALAGLVAVAIERARLAAEEAERKRLAAELDVARRIQESLAPRDLPSLRGFDLATRSRPCVETSGDYHDVIPLADGRVALVVGDVSGHGLGAALFMTSVRALLRASIHASPDPVAPFEVLNAYLCRDMPAESFMSLFVGVLDAAGATLRWVSAGHNPPLLLARGKEPVELERTGSVLGFFEDAKFLLSDPVPLRPGDALLLYTDGLFESRRADGEPFGDERMREAFARRVAAGDSASDLVAGLISDLEAFVGSRGMEDDVTCMALLTRGVEARP